MGIQSPEADRPPASHQLWDLGYVIELLRVSAFSSLKWA